MNNNSDQVFGDCSCTQPGQRLRDDVDPIDNGRSDRSGWALVIVTYQPGAELADCLASLRAVAPAPSEVIVVDNGSTNGQVEAICARFPEVTLISTGINAGYAAAANRGIARTQAPIVAVANPDVTFDTPVDDIVQRFEREPSLGAVGPRILEPDGTRYPSARRIPDVFDAAGHALAGLWWSNNPWTRRYRQADMDPERPAYAEWISGSCLWLRRCAVDQIGGWDERFFMYMEDVDLGWRLGRAGWKVAYEPAVTVTHIGGTATRSAPTAMLIAHHVSAFRFTAKRYTGLKRLLLIPAGLLLSVRAVAKIVVTRVESAFSSQRRRG
ncbi:MAG: glycosyltransferase family 2 protein [Acidimicrobiia bacterium]|nr:glycosyltransferase family 2 protein [Acidimicrobiia bacterium]